MQSNEIKGIGCYQNKEIEIPCFLIREQNIIHGVLLPNKRSQITRTIIINSKSVQVHTFEYQEKQRSEEHDIIQGDNTITLNFRQHKQASFSTNKFAR